MSDQTAFVLDQLAKSGRYHITKPDHVLVQCPIHASGQERTPSRKINLTNPRFKPLESFCYACDDDDKRKSWNELAAVMGMAPIRGEEDSGEDTEDSLWLKLPPREDFYGSDDTQVAHFPWKGAWRGIAASLLKRLEASEVNSKDEPRIYFPVMVDGVEIGNVQCVVDTESDAASKVKYLLSGRWTQYTVYPLDIAFPMAENLGYIVVVEGLRDALNLLQYGVPAVCIWGTNGWTRAKREVLQDLGVKIVIAMDGDEAGHKARDRIEADCKRFNMRHAIINFEEDMDPGKLKRSEVLEIAEMFSKRLHITHPSSLRDKRVIQSLLDLFKSLRKAAHND